MGHKQRLVHQRFLRKWLSASLALVGSNFLGNSWVKSGCTVIGQDEERAHSGGGGRSESALDLVRIPNPERQHLQPERGSAYVECFLAM